MDCERGRGFSLFELLIVIAVIGIISALALPAYQSYIDTANMSKVTAHYQGAIRTAQNMFAKARTNAALGLATGLPAVTATTNKKGKVSNKAQKQANNAAGLGWIEILNRDGIAAPGGGPAYVTTTDVNQSDANAVGAIRIDYNQAKQELTIWRPKYLELSRYRAIVSADKVETREYQN